MIQQPREPKGDWSVLVPAYLAVISTILGVAALIKAWLGEQIFWAVEGIGFLIAAALFWWLAESQP